MSKIDKLDARLDGIGHLLADRKIIVPPHQRAYSWTDEQITELLKDLFDAIRKKDVEYFLGTVVLTKNKEGSHFVIDGQQRLATVSVLIAAIRNYFYEANDNERADGLHQAYLAKKELRGLTETAHLTLIASDNGFYEEHILAKPAGRDNGGKKQGKKAVPVSHGRLARARELCTEHVNVLAKQTSQPAQLLLDWVEYVHSNAKVIVVEVNDEAAAYTIFEVLNDRGLDLSVSDLLKNFIFQTAEDKVTEAQQHWTSMVGVLEASGAEEKTLRTFIRHVWSSRHGVTREKELYDSIRSYVTGKQRAVDFVKDLSGQASIYAALDNPSDEFWKEYGVPVRESVEALQLLKATQIRPLIIAILKHFDAKEVRKALPMLVCWTVRFLIVGKVGSGPLESGYAERAKEISGGSIKTAAELFEGSKFFLASDGEFELAFRTARVSSASLGRFYLRVLEKQHTSSAGKELIVNPSEEAVTLEHIMPQTWQPHWTAIPVETHRANVKRIGNLALLDKALNESGGNLAFPEKVKTLAQSRIELTREVGALASWDTKAIDERQTRLAQLAVKAWPLKPRP